IPPAHLDLPRLPTAAWAAVVEDELVARRVGELEAANLYDAAQTAARHGDWLQVDRLLREAREHATDNEWLTAVVEKLERLALRRDEMMFSKETMYTSRKMRSRLATTNEADALNEAAPSYLRRKLEQGKS